MSSWCSAGETEARQSAVSAQNAIFSVTELSCSLLFVQFEETYSKYILSAFKYNLSSNFTGKRPIQSLQIWYIRRRRVNTIMWMRTAVTVFLCPTLRFTTTTSMISSKMLNLTRSDQSKGHKSKSGFAFWNKILCSSVCAKLSLLHHSQMMCTTVVPSYYIASQIICSIIWDIHFIWCCSSSMLKTCTFKNAVFVRWVAGGTPVRNNEFMYVATKEH